jgi:hypothetical protein
MKEAEWLACEDPSRMLINLRVWASDRKRRLFAVACCRRIGELLAGAAAREAVDVAEQYADGLAGGPDLERVYPRALEATGPQAMMQEPAEFAAAAAAWAASRDEMERAAEAALGAVFYGTAEEGRSPSRDEERRAQAALIRCVVGPRFRRAPLDPAWLAWQGGTVRKLAEAIYEGRAFDRLPVLGDALEDAGCTDANMLDHCRGPGPHARGCWAVDLLLGKP